MPQETNWIQEIRVAVSAKSDSDSRGVVLLHRHKRADWDFREKFSSSFLRQANAAV